MQGAGIYKFATEALMNAYTPDITNNAAAHAYPLDTNLTYRWDGTAWVLDDIYSTAGSIVGTNITITGNTGFTPFNIDISSLATDADLASTANGDGASLIGIEDAAGNITATTVEGALAELAANSHVPVATVDSNTIDFTVSGTDNQTITAIIAGADTATNGQTPISDGAGGITWTTPAAGHPAVTLDAGVNPALSLVGATQVLSLNLDTAGSYDNTTSGLTATSIQDAIDEILASAKSYTLAFPDNSTIELRDEDNALVSSFTRNTFTKADTDSIVTTVTVTNQPSQSDGRNLEYKADIVVAPAQGGVPNALSVIAGQGVYVAATTALPEYDSNALAIAGGLTAGDYYQLSVNNIYGLPHGLHITVV